MNVTPEARRLIRLLRPLLRRRGKPAAQLQPFLKAGLLHSPRWGWQENIVGYSLSTKNGQLCLTIFVRCKRHRGRLNSKEFIPEGIRVPGLKNLELLTRLSQLSRFESAKAFRISQAMPKVFTTRVNQLWTGIGVSILVEVILGGGCVGRANRNFSSRILTSDSGWV